MTRPTGMPVGIELHGDIEVRPDRPLPYRARVRWTEPSTRQRPSKSVSFEDRDEAQHWLDNLRRLANSGIHPATATMSVAEYGESVKELAIRGLEPKTLDPYLAGWRLRVVPTLGHLQTTTIRTGDVDRAAHGWIADGHGLSTIKNSLAVLSRILNQAVRDNIIDRNPARITGWQREFHLAEDELDDPRSLALPDWDTLTRLADALVARSHGHYQGWGDIVTFAAATGARIGEVSGVRLRDINTTTWRWTIRRQTTTSPGGLADKATKGKRARIVPLIPEIHDLVQRRIAATDGRPDARLFRGPRGGRVTTAILRDATHWDAVVSEFGYEHLRRHDLRHTGLTWMADAGVPVHILRVIAGHRNLATTQRYLHSGDGALAAAGQALSRHLRTGVVPSWSPGAPKQDQPGLGR